MHPSDKYPHSTTTSEISALPANIFGPIDAAALEHAASRIRGMDDLQASVERMSWAAAMMDSQILAGYDEETTRHINRGISLVNLLLEEVAPDYHRDNTQEFVNSMRDIHDRSAHSETFVSAGAALRVAYSLAATVGTRPSDIQTFHETATTVLDRAGIAPELFAQAVHNLSGRGLEMPTRLQEASFGAAAHIINTAIVANL
jgi:hypothetical protein